MSKGITGVTASVPAFIARTQFGQILDRVANKSERFLISKRGRPSAVIVSVEDYARMTGNPEEALAELRDVVQKAQDDSSAVEDIQARIHAVREG